MPPDHIYHHGILGMHWGIRKEEIPVYKKGTRRLVPYKKQKIRKGTVRGVPYSKPMTKTRTRIVLRPHTPEEERLTREIAAGKARKKADRAAKRYARLTNTPYHPDKNQYKRHVNSYELALKGLAIGAAGTVIGAVLRPSADSLGKYILKYGSEKLADQARKKALGF